MKFILAVLLSVSFIYANEKVFGKYQYQLTPMAGYTIPDTGMDGFNSIGAEFEMRDVSTVVNPYVSTFYGMRANYYANTDKFKTDWLRIYAGVTHDFDYIFDSPLYTPYAKVGLGYGGVFHQMNNYNDTPLLQYGLGVTLSVFEQLGWKFEVLGDLGAKKNNSTYNSLNLFAGIVWAFSDKSPPKVIKSAMPVKRRMDNDKDGVYDDEDHCLNTPSHHKVDQFGCSKSTTIRVNFTFDSDAIPNTAYARLDKFAHFMFENPEYKVYLIGHTDSVGTKVYNMKLSKRRAHSIANYLMEQGVAEKRMITIGKGDEGPIASNTTEEGRAMNRRTDITFVRIPYIRD